MNFTLNSQEVNLDYLEKDEKLIMVNSSPLWRKIYTLSIRPQCMGLVFCAVDSVLVDWVSLETTNRELLNDALKQINSIYVWRLLHFGFIV